MKCAVAQVEKLGNNLNTSHRVDVVDGMFALTLGNAENIPARSETGVVCVGVIQQHQFRLVRDVFHT